MLLYSRDRPSAHIMTQNAGQVATVNVLARHIQFVVSVILAGAMFARMIALRMIIPHAMIVCSTDVQLLRHLGGIKIMSVNGNLPRRNLGECIITSLVCLYCRDRLYETYIFVSL